MVTINRLDGPVIPQGVTQPTAVDGPKAPKGTAPVTQDGTERIAGAQQRSLAELGPPPLPKVELDSAAFTHADSFTAQLRDMGAPALSNEELLAKFLKLQMLGGTWDLINQYMTSEAYSALRQDAYAMTKSNRLNQADNLRAQADSIEQQADDLIARASESASPEGQQAAAEAQLLYDQAVALRERAHAATDPAEAERLNAQAAELEAQAQAKLDAAGKNGDAEAIGQLTQAAALYEQAGTLRDQAGAIIAGYTDGLAVTAMVRKGSDFLMTQVRSQDYLKELTNKLRAMLDNERADKRALEDALRQMEESRIEVAAMLLNFIDRHSQMNAGATRART